MEQKIEPVKTWGMKFAELGISEETLRDANISSDFYDDLYDLCKVINHGRKQKIAFAWQLQLLTGKRDYYELYCVYGDTDDDNPAFYAFCSGSIEAYTYIQTCHADLLVKLGKSEDGKVISTYCAIKKCNIVLLQALVKLFQCPDLCLIACIGSDWLEGVKWINQHYPQAFTEVENFRNLMDCIYYPHHIAFERFNLPILDWFKENRGSLFGDKRLCYRNIDLIVEDSIRQETTEKLDWLSSNTTVVIDRNILLKNLVYSPKPKVILEWFKKNRPEFFPLAGCECYALANSVLSREKPEVFNDIIFLGSETNLTHFPFILERDNLKTCLKNFNIALTDNFCMETFSIQHDYSRVVFFQAGKPDYDMTGDPVYLDVLDKLLRNRALKTWSKFSLMLIGILDGNSVLSGLCFDLVVNFSKHLIALYKEFGSWSLHETEYNEEGSPESAACY